MSHINGTTRFDLDYPLQYSKGGEFVDAGFIEFSEFNSAHKGHYYKLRERVMKVFLGMQKLRDKASVDPVAQADTAKSFVDRTEVDHDKDAKELASAISEGVFIIDDFDVGGFVDTFRNMVCHTGAPLALIDGDEPLKPAVFDKMHPDDQLRAAAYYCGFFGIGLGGHKKTGQNVVTMQRSQAKAL
jgi:hypothetical protein